MALVAVARPRPLVTLCEDARPPGSAGQVTIRHSSGASAVFTRPLEHIQRYPHSLLACMVRELGQQQGEWCGGNSETHLQPNAGDIQLHMEFVEAEMQLALYVHAHGSICGAPTSFRGNTGSVVWVERVLDLYCLPRLLDLRWPAAFAMQLGGLKFTMRVLENAVVEEAAGRVLSMLSMANLLRTPSSIPARFHVAVDCGNASEMVELGVYKCGAAGTLPGALYLQGEFTDAAGKHPSQANSFQVHTGAVPFMDMAPHWLLAGLPGKVMQVADLAANWGSEVCSGGWVTLLMVAYKR